MSAKVQHSVLFFYNSERVFTVSYQMKIRTLWFQLEYADLLISTFLLFDPVLFPIYEARLLIGSILNFEALLGAPLIKTT